MTLITIDGNYSDENGNSVHAPSGLNNVTVKFSGKNNKLVISNASKVNNTKIEFYHDNGTCLIGPNSYKGFLRIGSECLIIVGARVSCTNATAILTAEKTYAIVGDDTMIATSTSIRCEDAHAIYSVNSGERLNPSRNVVIGEHVWIADHATVLSNTYIGAGSIIGARSVVKGKFPNNSLIVGVPSKVVKKDVAWERPHLTFAPPLIKKNAFEQDLVTNDRYWNNTDLNTKKIGIGVNAYFLLKEFKDRYPNFDFSNLVDTVDYYKNC